MENETNKINLQKYIWLHRIHVSAILFILINFASKILKSPNITILFFPILAFYLIFPRTLESVFQFSKGFYVWTFAIGVALSFSGGAGAPNSVLAFFGYIGTASTLLLFFIAFNSFFILKKVFKMNFRGVLSYGKRRPGHDP